MGQFQAT